MATRNGSARWRGDLQGGDGSLTVGDGVFEGPYSYASRFEEGGGTNPEELIAAAHAGCYTMMLSGVLGKQGHTADELSTSARVHLRNVDGAPTIARIEFETEGRVPGVDQEAFQGAAEEAKDTCIVTRALAGVGEITVQARLAA